MTNKQLKVTLFLIIVFCFIFLRISLAETDQTNSQNNKPPREELIWYEYEKNYMDINDIKNSLEEGTLVTPPEFFKTIGIINKGAGDLDPDNAKYYWAAKPGTLGLMLTVAKELKLRLKNPSVRLPISGLLRTVEYQNILYCSNSWADKGRSTHINGATFDITINPQYMDLNTIQTLEILLKELHAKKEIFFINEVANCCFHVCINPDYTQKYETIFYNLSKEYEMASLYSSGTTIFQLIKDSADEEEGVKIGNLVSISAMNLPVNVESTCSSDLLRPETAGLLLKITEKLKSVYNKDFILPLSQLTLPVNEYNERSGENPILPSQTPFNYGTAFQVGGASLSSEEIAVLEQVLEEMSKSNDLTYIKRDDNKYDITMNPSAISKYRLAYQNKYSNIEQKGVNSFKFDLKYLYLTVTMLIGLFIGFVIFRFYQIKILRKKRKMMKKKKKKRAMVQKQIIYIDDYLNKYDELDKVELG